MNDKPATQNRVDGENGIMGLAAVVLMAVAQHNGWDPQTALALGTGALGVLGGVLSAVRRLRR